MWIYAILLVVGLNVGYIEALKEMSLLLRIGAHFIVTILLLVGVRRGINKRMEKYQNEIVPLIKKLNEIKN